MDDEKQQVPLSLKITADGSHTLWRDDWCEPFHSMHGAIQESEHVFIRAGLELCSQKFRKVKLLEIGLGTGLNALLAWQFAIKHNIEIEYTAIEPFPLPRELARQLNYAEMLATDGSHHALQAIHEALYTNTKTEAGKQFSIQVIKSDFREVCLGDGVYHCIFFDAFDPAKEPYLWTASAFRQLWESMLEGGILVTYSAKGQVRRNLKEAGFRVEKLHGPPGKKEITRATKIQKI